MLYNLVLTPHHRHQTFEGDSVSIVRHGRGYRQQQQAMGYGIKHSVMTENAHTLPFRLVNMWIFYLFVCYWFCCCFLSTACVHVLYLSAKNVCEKYEKSKMVLPDGHTYIV